MRVTTPAIWVAVTAAVAACGGSSSTSSPAPAPGPVPPPSSFVITISGMAFSPLDLHVPAGGTVTVVNKDGIDHSVTSETAPNMFTPGSVGGVQFDTGLFVGTKTFTIAASAAAGTVVPYYCRNHLNTMATPTGMITIDPNAATTSMPAPSSGGGGMPTPSTPPPSMPGY